MKRILLALLLALTGLCAYAYDFKFDGIYYNILSDGVSVEVTSGSSDKYSGAINIPSSVTYSGKTYSVTSIGSEAFSSCSGLTAVTIPNSVTSIGGNAFYGCSGLTSVTIPNSVTSIGVIAFVGCSSLTSVVFNAENCIDMGGQYPAFINCTSISTLTIGESVKNIPTNAFYGCSGLTSVTIPNSVTTIGIGAFSGCSGLTGALTIPKSVTSIGKNAFNGAAQVTEILLGESVANIGASAFAGMDRVAKITSLNPTPPECAAPSVFQDITKDKCKLYVPAGKKTTYAETYVWWDFTNIIELQSIDVESITLDAESLTMPIGSSTTITYTIAPDNATTTALEWSVSNPAVASIVDHNDGTATVKALSIGEATITAKATDGSNVTATCAVKVEPIWVSSLTLSAEQLEMNVGDSEVITYTILPANATNKSVAWSSSDPAVASITTNADGSVTVNALAIGEATITARTIDGSNLAASCVVKVTPTLVKTLTLSAEQLEMNVGDSEVITYTILPEDAADKSVAWSSNDPAVASITTNADGSVTVNALAIGEATITAHTLDGSNLAASCVVKVGSAGVGDFDAADIEIFAAAEGIVVKGAPADCIIDVYTAAGVLVYHGYDSLIPIRNHGIYFVFVAGVKAKVVL